MPLQGIDSGRLETGAEIIPRRLSLGRYTLGRNGPPWEGVGGVETMPRDCPRCHEQNSAQANYCPLCGLPLDSAKGARDDGRRRRVTGGDIWLFMLFGPLACLFGDDG